jgi:creatinine amidohydrolase
MVAGTMKTQPEVRLGKLTRREFRARMQCGELKACILPTAAMEQHLEHMAMEHDWRSATEIATRVAEMLRPEVLVAEGLMAGISEHHMTHPGTLSLSPGVFLATLSDLISSIARAGFNHILVLNGHGGNTAPCRAVWDQFQRLHQVNLHFLPYWEVLTEHDAKELLTGGHRIPTDLPGHAQEFETSIALAAFPENVRQEMWTDQTDQSPSKATARQGRIFLERITERVAAYLREMINGTRQAGIPPYFP